VSSRSLVVLPDDSFKPVLRAIGTASKSLRAKMFVLSDPTVVQALVAARRRGVKVQVILNRAPHGSNEKNEFARAELLRAGVEVAHGNPEFSVTHEKSMVVDDAIAFVKSFNWAPKNFRAVRDYAVITSHEREVREIADCFDADWHRQRFRPGEPSGLIWCPGGRDRFVRLIDEAKHTLNVQNDRYRDLMILEHLIRAARRGVKVRVMARPPHRLEDEKLLKSITGLRIMDDVGIRIRKLKHLKLHGKMVLADGVAAIVGSINFSPGTFSDRRELAIEVRDPDVVKRLQDVAHHDWKRSRPIDLSDEWILATLEDRDQAGKEPAASDAVADARPRKLG